jgi:hypothetical protein
VTSNTDPAFVRGTGESIKHEAWLDNKRAELSDVAIETHPRVAPDGQPYFYWYGWSYFIPDDPNWSQTVNPLTAGETDLVQYIAQMRFSNLGGCAVMKTCNDLSVGGSGHHLIAREGHMVFTMTLNDDVCASVRPNRLRQVDFDLGPLTRGVWIDFVIQARWTTDETGIFKVWIQRDNGGYVHAADYRGPTWFRYREDAGCQYVLDGDPVAMAPNLQLGLYWSNDKPLETTPRTMYSDNIRIRRTLCPDSVGSDGWNKVVPAAGEAQSSAPPGRSVIPVEFEKVSVTTSPGVTKQTVHESGASGGVWLKVNSTAVGQHADVSFWVPEAKSYSLLLKVKQGPWYGKSELLIGPTFTDVHAVMDQYQPDSEFVTLDLGDVELPAGLNTFRWRTVQPSGSAYAISLDGMVLEEVP